MKIRLVIDGRLGCPSRSKAIEISEQRTIDRKAIPAYVHDLRNMLFLSASPDISTLRYSSSNLYYHLRYPSNRP
ncbi:hypothetical protein T4B_7270 [Trichinella pseudospiralis]|uniref:Uncharacterized protein n=1 Tax=Trichinella pseudospiralis TaxID=6337 RepID=A0A0V1IUC5_TRIPS|nr:hypothetical protein T4B_7270 [Trichinella pseudospiralis]